MHSLTLFYEYTQLNHFAPLGNIVMWYVCIVMDIINYYQTPEQVSTTLNTNIFYSITL